MCIVLHTHVVRSHQQHHNECSHVVGTFCFIAALHDEHMRGTYMGQVRVGKGVVMNNARMTARYAA
jgi:hypothetical protein